MMAFRRGDRFVVLERDRRQPGAIERPVGEDDVVAEAGGQLRQQRRAGHLQLADDAVGVDDDRATRGEA